MKLIQTFAYITITLAFSLPLVAKAQSYIFRDTFQNSLNASVEINGRTPTLQPTAITTWNSSGNSIRVAGNTYSFYGLNGLLFLQNGTSGGVANFELGSAAVTTGDIITLQFDVERLDRASYRNGWLGVGFTNSASDNLAAANSGPWIRMEEDGRAWLYGGGGTSNGLSIDSHFSGVGGFVVAAGQSFTTVTFTLNTGTLAYSLDNGSGEPLTGTLIPTHTPNYEILQIRWFSSNSTAMSAMRIGELNLTQNNKR